MATKLGSAIFFSFSFDPACEHRRRQCHAQKRQDVAIEAATFTLAGPLGSMGTGKGRCGWPETLNQENGL